eukprot:c14667_g1_i1 orf=303-497(-)
MTIFTGMKSLLSVPVILHVIGKLPRTMTMKVYLKRIKAFGDYNLQSSTIIYSLSAGFSRRIYYG